MIIPIICYKFPPYYSGYGKQLKTVVEKIGQIDRNKKFIIITAFGKSYEEKNYSVKSMGLNYKNSSKKNLYSFSFQVFKFIIKNRKKIALIHCVKAGPEALSAKIASVLLKIPIVIKIAQDELSEFELKNKHGLNKLRVRIRHDLLLLSSNFIAISKDIEKMLNNKIKGKSKVWFIPNGVKTDKFLSKQDYFIKKEVIDFLYVGAINKRKGIYDLLDALDSIEINKKVKFTLFGPLLEDIRFEERLAQINRNENITINYMGEINNVEKVMTSSDVFILLSYSEGLPNVLLEAASSGLPLIGTNIPGSRDIVLNNYNGKIVRPGNITEIKEIIKYFSENQKDFTNMGTKSRKLIEEEYDMEIISRKYIDMYQKISGI